MQNQMTEDNDVMLQEMHKFSRRECLEVVGKPRQVDDKNSETKVLPIFQKVDLIIGPAFIDDCNRLGKFNDRVIVKLTRRKYPKQILKVKEGLGDLNMEDLNVLGGTKTYINQN